MPPKKPFSVIESFESHGTNIHIQSSDFKTILTKKEHQNMMKDVAETIARVWAEHEQNSHHHQDMQKRATDMSQVIANMEDFAQALNAVVKQAENTELSNDTNQNIKNNIS